MMSITPRSWPRAAVQPAPSIEATLSSTTPDVPRRAALLPITGTLGAAVALGIGAGALLLRAPGAGWKLGAVAAGAAKGAGAGALVGAALLGIDRVTDGQVKRQLDLISLDRRAQIRFVLSHPTKPWIAGLGLGVASAAREAQYTRFGTAEPMDGAQDAFRHAYAAALFSLRAMRDHHVSPSTAHELAIAAGDAHEADGQDNNDAWSRAMDEANNAAGTRIVGDGRARPGEPADATGFVTEPVLQQRVLQAMERGELQVIDRAPGADPAPRPTRGSDVPRQ